MQRRPHRNWKPSLLALKVADVKFQAVTLPHLDGEKVVVVALSLSTRCVLGEERFEHLEVVERMWRKEIESIRDYTFHIRKKGKAHKRIVVRVHYHFISEMYDVLDSVAHSGVVIESWSRELS